jgi:hypothetical protein
MSKKKINSSGVAARYDRSLKTIDRWVELGILPKPQYINGYKYWDEEELEAADAAREQGSPRIPTNIGARSKGNAVDPEKSAEARKAESAILDRSVAS